MWVIMYSRVIDGFVKRMAMGCDEVNCKTIMVWYTHLVHGTFWHTGSRA